MGQPAARLTDLHTCPMVTGVVPHVGGPVAAPGAPSVLIGGLPAARVTDMATCTGPPDIIMKGSDSVTIGGLPAARMGDPTSHGGVLTSGCSTVLIGDRAGGGTGSGSGSGSAGDSAAGQIDDPFSELLTTGPAFSAPLTQARAVA